MAFAAAASAPPKLRRALRACPSAYYAGAIAPDARERDPASRAATHFYGFTDPQTWGAATRALFRAYPRFADPAALSEAQAAYVAGYLTHLAADEVFVLRLGSHAVQLNGEAIGGLAYVIEAGAAAASDGLAEVFGCLRDFQADGIETIVDPARLTRHAHAVGLIDPQASVGELRRAIAGIIGRRIDADQAEREAQASVAAGARYFGRNAADDFFAGAQAEAVRRLRAFARGAAAGYDAPHLRPARRPVT